jgi:hypothetical protein
MALEQQFIQPLQNVMAALLHAVELVRQEPKLLGLDLIHIVY